MAEVVVCYKKGCSRPRLAYSPLCRAHANEKALAWYKTPQGQAQLRRSNLWVAYRTTPEAVEAAFKKQAGRCAICKEPIRLYVGQNAKGKAQIDHNHLTRTFRALLCRRCNQGLGRFKDSPALLQAAIAYLRKHDK